MDYKKLVIGLIHVAKPENSVILGANFLEDTQLDAVQMPNSFFIELYKGKIIKITGNDYLIKAKIKDVQVSTSISDYKNIDFLTDLKDVGKIKLNDLIEVE